MKKLGDAELEIMKVLWSHSGPLTSNQILEGLAGIKDWKLSSIMTALARLAKKGFVHCDRTTRTNYYSALVGEAEYKLAQSRSFLEKLYDNSIQKLVSGLYDGNSISADDIRGLREYLEKLEEGRGN